MRRSEFTANEYLLTMSNINPHFTQRPKHTLRSIIADLIERLILGTIGLVLFASIGVLLAWRG